MRKLTLSVESLEVESFETDDAEARRGTVRANSGDDSVGCTYFCTCTCTLEGGCCPSRGCDTGQGGDGPDTAAATA